jgi:hypothetical protein
MPAVAATTDLPRPFRPRVTTRAMAAMHKVLDRRNPLWYAAAVLLHKTPPLYKAFTFGERLVKSRLFGCRMCGQCALPVTAYACPMTCPKQLRNGPCGGKWGQSSWVNYWLGEDEGLWTSEDDPEHEPLLLGSSGRKA